MIRVGTALWNGAIELRRTPVLFALLVLAPAYVIYLFRLVVLEGTAIVHIGEDVIWTPLRGAFPVFGSPIIVALLSGATALFLMHSSAGSLLPATAPIRSYSLDWAFSWASRRLQPLSPST